MPGNVIPNRLNVSAPVRIATNDTTGHLGQLVDEPSAGIILRNSQAQATAHNSICFAYVASDPISAISSNNYNLNYHVNVPGVHRFWGGTDYSDGTAQWVEIGKQLTPGNAVGITLLNGPTGVKAGLYVDAAGKLWAFDNAGVATKLTP